MYTLNFTTNKNMRIVLIVLLCFQSGAILSVVGYFSLSNPDQKLGIIFLPNIQFDAIHVSHIIFNYI